MSSEGNVTFVSGCKCYSTLIIANGALIIQSLCKEKVTWHYSLSNMGPWRLGSPPSQLFSFVCFMSFTGKNGSVCSLVLGKEKWYLLLDSPKNPRLRKGQESLSWTINRSRSDAKCHLPQSSNSKLILPRVCCNRPRNTMRPVPSSLGKVRSPEKKKNFFLQALGWISAPYKICFKFQ